MSNENLLRDAYLSAHALDGVWREIDPRDEMYQHLCRRPHGPDSPKFDYVRSGHEAFQTIEHVLSHLELPTDRLGRVLDFACGFGRLARFLVDAFGPERVWVSDIDPNAVAYIRESMGTHGFVSCTDPDELEMPGDFDLVWVGSMFSHLPRPRFAAWLRKLVDALAPDGTLLFSTHGARLNHEVDPDPSGFTYVTRSETERLDGAEYGTAYVEPAQVEEIARACGVEQLVVLEKDLWSFQDLFVARRTPHPGLGSLRSTPTIEGRITELKFPQPDHAWTCGWARTVGRDGPVDEVRICIDGQDVTAARLGETKEVAAAEPNRDAEIAVEWYTEGDVSWLAPGVHCLTAVAHSRGRTRCIDAKPLVIERGGAS